MLESAAALLSMRRCSGLSKAGIVCTSIADPWSNCMEPWNDCM